jgi:cytochrome c oxidase cbb3-type subunit IV
MYKEVLRSIAGIEWFPIVGLVIFFTFFMLWLVYVMSMKKQEISVLESLPFGNDEQTDRKLTTTTKADTSAESR